MQVPCPKCYGIRRFETLRHVADGVCFRCNGAGVVELTIAECAHREATRRAFREVEIQIDGRAFVACISADKCGGFVVELARKGSNGMSGGRLFLDGNAARAGRVVVEYPSCGIEDLGVDAVRAALQNVIKRA